MTNPFALILFGYVPREQYDQARRDLSEARDRVAESYSGGIGDTTNAFRHAIWEALEAVPCELHTAMLRNYLGDSADVVAHNLNGREIVGLLVDIISKRAEAAI